MSRSMLQQSRALLRHALHPPPKACSNIIGATRLIRSRRPLSRTPQQHSHAAVPFATPATTAVSQRAPTLSIDDFQARADRNEATLSDAQACLAHIQHEWSSLPLPQQKERCLELQPGGRVLRWIWQTQLHDLNRVCEDHAFANRLCYFLVGEGLEEFIWKWLAQEADNLHTPFRTGKSSYGDRPHDWTYRLLAGLAHAHWSWAPDASPNAALRCFKRAVDAYGHIQPGFSPLYVPIYAVLAPKLQSETCPVFDEALFACVFHNVSRHERTPSHQRECQARLALYHPTKPEGLPLLQLMEEPSPTKYVIRDASRPSRIAFCKHLLRAAYILRYQGRPSEAAKLENMEQSFGIISPKARHGFLDLFDNDPKLESVRRLDVHNDAKQSPA